MTHPFPIHCPLFRDRFIYLGTSPAPREIPFRANFQPLIAKGRQWNCVDNRVPKWSLGTKEKIPLILSKFQRQFPRGLQLMPHLRPLGAEIRLVVHIRLDANRDRLDNR